MAEVLADFPYQVVDPRGHEYFVSVAGAQKPDGMWDGWLEFVPLDETEPLVTPKETTQSNRAALQHWAEALEETYVKGAFNRAVSSVDALDRRAFVRYEAAARVPLNDVDVPDPFHLIDSGHDVMRHRLNALSRVILLDIIDTFMLNPAGKSLSWLSDRQLVTFIITSVETQITMGKGPK
jgi:hypothetical protein